MKSLILLSTAVACAACAGGSTTMKPAGDPAPVATSPVSTPALASAPAPAPAPQTMDIDPTGSYTVSLAYGGQPLDITLEMGRGTDGVLGGQIYAEQVPAIAFNTITVTGKRVQATLTAPDGSAVSLDFTIEGAELNGTWKSSNGDGSPISGRKTP